MSENNDMTKPERSISHGLYVLVDRKPAPELDWMKWAQWFERSDERIVRQTDIGDRQVSTVFIGCDMPAWRSREPGLFETREPELFETIVFAPEGVSDRIKSATWEEAEEVHRRVCAHVEYCRNRGLNAGPGQ